jgi:hypothetical protein
VPGDAHAARLLRAAVEVIVVSIAARVLRGPALIDIAVAGLGVGLAALLYRTRGWPFSFSAVNSPEDIPRFAFETIACAAIGILFGAALRVVWRRLRGARTAFDLPLVASTASLLLAIALAAATGAISGPSARTALDHPAAAYFHHLALVYLAVAGLMARPLVVLVALLVKVHVPPAEEPYGSYEEGRP